MCTVLLPPRVNPVAVNKYIDIKVQKMLSTLTQKCKWVQEVKAGSNVFYDVWVSACVKYLLKCYLKEQ